MGASKYLNHPLNRVWWQKGCFNLIQFINFYFILKLYSHLCTLCNLLFSLNIFRLLTSFTSGIGNGRSIRTNITFGAENSGFANAPAARLFAVVPDRSVRRTSASLTDWKSSCTIVFYLFSNQFPFPKQIISPTKAFWAETSQSFFWQVYTCFPNTRLTASLWNVLFLTWKDFRHSFCRLQK